MARRAWVEQGRLLGQVDGGQLEQAVAVVGHHHLDRGVGQFGPHGLHLLGQGLVVHLGLVGPVRAAQGGRRGPWGTGTPGRGPSHRSFAVRCPE